MTLKQRIAKFAAFIVEREHIRILREDRKQPAPWTNDKILRTYRFCNVRREDDRVTRWIARHWRDKFADYPQLWFALVVARLVNHPPTLKQLALPGRWNAQQFVKTLHQRARQQKKVFGSAYIVSTNGRAMDKAEYLAEQVLTPMWKNRSTINALLSNDPTCRRVFTHLNEYQGMGSFMTAQVIADLKYVPPLDQASDWWTFAASGPGSRRGLNRVLGNDVKAPWMEDEWFAALNLVSKQVMPYLRTVNIARLHAQDIQNCLCEFDKYERVRLSEGRPRQLFTPHE